MLQSMSRDVSTTFLPKDSYHVANRKPKPFPMSASNTVNTNGEVKVFGSNTGIMAERPSTGSGVIKDALKKMRGVSISVEYCPAFDDKHMSCLSPIEVELLSQELRKAKVASIWTSNVEAIEYLVKEQNTAKGNFPGPIPIVYQNVSGEQGADGDHIIAAIRNGAAAVALDSKSLNVYRDVMKMDHSGSPVDAICKVENVQDIQAVIESGIECAFLVSGNHSDDEMQQMLNVIPKASLVIASLSSMQPESQEISRAKALAGLTSNSSKISSILIQEACVGDQEDIKYTSFVIESVNKKSSSTFQMTGLTGAANGHFGSDVSGGFRAAKWQRNKDNASTVL